MFHRFRTFKNIAGLLKPHHWFDSYGNFTNMVYFAYRWSCISKGLLVAFEAGLFNLNPVSLRCCNPIIG